MCGSQVEIQFNVWFSGGVLVECVVLRLGFSLMCGSQVGICVVLKWRFSLMCGSQDGI